jgi:hypothetical protein
MKTSTLSPFALLIVCLLPVSGTWAQTIVGWTFNNTNIITYGSGAHLAATNITIGPDIDTIEYNGAVEFFGQSGWPTTTTLDPNAYFQFTVTAGAGYYLQLNTVTLTIRRSTTGTSGAGPQSWSLRSSLDGYSTDLLTGTLTTSYQTVPVTLPAAFQSIASTVTFRLYGYNAQVSTGGSSRVVTNGITIQGQTPVTVLAVQSLNLTASTSASTSASTNSGAVNLQWQAEGFAAGTDYKIERSTNGTDFTVISQQSAATAATTAFQYEDGAAPAATQLFYRIEAEQPDGSSAYSPTVVVSATSAGGATAIRSVAPEGSNLMTLLHLAASGNYQLNIWSADGKILYRQVVQEQAGDYTTDISFGTHAHGIYILTLTGSGVRTSREFIY